ncbi:kinase-like protein [Boletus reticuloceps]|uniref:Kinase-like protein n=1 Tax=Boletus reticuloceps TaxID=495285 RepID=A0A8I2YNK3_9AGAM|nr:kinase-like protein [Boletus reticuloceps]
MLQYSAQPIPLPISYKSQLARKDILPEHRSNDPPTQLNPPSSRLFNKRFTKDRSSRASQQRQQPPLSHLNHPSPHSISISLPASSQASSPRPSPLPLPPLLSPAPSSSLTLPSPLPSSAPLRLPSSSLRPHVSRSATPIRPSSSGSSVIEDVLAPGDFIGEVPTLALQRSLKVVRKLGTGSYAVVYLVREVLSRAQPSEDGHCGIMDFGELPHSKSYITYGRDFALKCLSKANLDQEALAAQMTEVTIHQSLRPHPNIVTLYRTFETPAFLLLLLEYVPGEDLFYFLEQARDHYDPTPVASQDVASSPSRTPPTPSLLASLHPSQLLSPTRLRLIARMFSQMCDAVASCHEQGVFHRDIKPENFIVTDGFVNGERRVVVKLTDFGLSTTEADCSDMDCGSAPYMSFECRNNCAPTYQPAPADVWSLGIVLINMLYHYNPWTDTAQGVCPSFNLFRHHTSNFFMQRFTGMTTAVAEFLATRVFYLPLSASFSLSENMMMPVTAREFGAWIRDLPALLSESTPLSRPVPGHKRVVSASSITVGHPLSSCPPSRRPSSRAGGRTPVIHSRSLSRAPSFGPPFEKTGLGLETVPNLDMSVLQEMEGEILKPSHIEVIEEVDAADEQEFGSENKTNAEQDMEDGRSRSTKKRGRRGARKSKQLTNDVADETLEVLASASQTLAREISLVSPSIASSKIPAVLVAETQPLATGAPASQPVAPVVAKKASKWKLSFGGKGHPSPVEEPVPGTASNVTSLIMGLSPLPASRSTTSSISHQTHALQSPYTRTPLTPQRSPADEAVTWTRGRQPPPFNPNTWGTSSVNGYGHSAGTSTYGNGVFADRRGSRGASPPSLRSAGLDFGSSNSVSTSSANKSNWRSSMSTTSSASTSTSAFTRYSNSSTRSISTMATSVSSGSWRTQTKTSGQSKIYGNDGEQQAIPKNVKILSGVPWELDQLPRQQHSNPDGDIFGQPPQRKPRTRKPKDPKLDTISERPGAPQKHIVQLRRDAATSTTDLDGLRENSETGAEGVPKKVQKGQINALAKMLSALRR